MIGFLSRIKFQIIAVFSAVVAAIGVLLLARREGRKDAEQDAKIKDQERADKIRDAVERNVDDRVRKYDDAGWRE